MLGDIRTALLTTSTFSALIFASSGALAQQAAPPDPSQPAEARLGGLEEIIVTAQRRGENLQKVPISISAFSSESLERSNITTARDLQVVDPSLNISGHSGSVLPFLRGVGNPSATTIGNEASVPIYIDEVYYTRVSPAYLELANIERVEVLKGPQGTLFGRNASGGLVHIITRDPSKTEPHLDAQVGYANFDAFTGKLYASTPLSSTAALDLSVSGRTQGDGWGRNVTTGSETYKDKFISIRSKLVAGLGDRTDIRLTGFYANQRTTKINLQQLYTGAVAGTPVFYGPAQPRPSLTDTSGRFYDTFSSVDAFNKFESWGGSLKITHDLDFADLVSISSYRKAKEFWQVDGDATEFNFLVYNVPSIDREITQELQLKSQTATSFDWILGAFYLDSKQGYIPTSITGDAIAAAGLASQDLYGVQRIHSYSGYGQATFHVVPDGTNITLGLRYTSDKVHGTGAVSAVLPNGAAIPLSAYDKSFNFTKLTYKVAVDHQFSNEVMSYVSFSRGYKSGTFNTLPLTTDPSLPEVVDAYEVGIKSTFFDRRVRLNVALFQNDIKSPQVQTIIPGSGGTSFVGLTNAEKARTRGFEFDLQAVLAEGLQLRVGGVLLEAQYTGFTNGPIARPVVDAQGRPVAPYGTSPLVTGDLSGARLAQVPKRRLTAGLNYDRETSIGTFNVDLNVSYTSEFPWEPDGILRQEAYTLVNASLKWSPPGQDRLSFRAWGKNLTDKQYYGSALSQAGTQQGALSVAAEPRTYGIEARYRL